MLEKNGIIWSKTSPKVHEVPYGDAQVLGAKRRRNGSHCLLISERSHADLAVAVMLQDRKAYEEFFGRRQKKKNYQILLRRLVRWLKGH